MTEKTKDLNMTQKALGHSTPKMTDRYRHVIDERLLQAFESVQFRPDSNNLNDKGRTVPVLNNSNNRIQVRPNKSVDQVSTQGLKEAVSGSL